MYYQVSKEFFDKLPNACFGAVAVRGLDNTHDIPELEEMLAGNVAECEAYFTGKKPKETEDILPYRAAFTALGINPNKFMCSIEALLTRIAKGKGFPHINAAVDLAAVRTRQDHREHQGHPVPHRRFLRRKCGGGTGGGGRTGGAAEKVFR